MAARKIIVGRGPARVEYKNELADMVEQGIRALIPDLMDYLDEESDNAKAVIDRTFPRRTGAALRSLEQANWIGAKLSWIKAGVRTDLQYTYKFRLKAKARKRKIKVTAIKRKRPTAWKAIVRKQYRKHVLNKDKIKELTEKAFRRLK